MKKSFIATIILLLVMAPAALAKKKQAPVMTDREKWADLAYRIAAPVLENMSRGELQKNMDLELSPDWDGRDPKGRYHSVACPSRRRHRRGSQAQAAPRVGHSVV